MCHPILEATAVLGAALKSVADVSPVFMSTPEKASALTELSRLEGQLAELKCRVLAAAQDVAETTAARDAAEWLARAGRERLEDTRRDLRLAVAVDARYLLLGTALREGSVNRAQAQVIATALDRLPAEIPTDLVIAAEERLVAEAASFGPATWPGWARTSSRSSPHIGEALEARRLATLEAAAHRATTLSLHRVGDGMTRITGLLPDAAATRLATYLEAFTNPRKDPEARGTRLTTSQDLVTRLPYGRRLGEAFCQLLECIDPTRLPLHAGTATTIMITLSLDQLRADLATAEVIGASHLPGTDDPMTITAAEARRLACTANLIPAVLDSDSQPLDLGRTRRLFTTAQRHALQLRDRHCQAEGCLIPGTWCEAHHWNPWAHGGQTNLNDGLLLCRHHHTTAHDPTYTHDRHPTGTIRFHPRR
ncbi:MAG: DUF222 domain-containing protein [Nocardioidaceae bacterium]